MSTVKKPTASLAKKETEIKVTTVKKEAEVKPVAAKKEAESAVAKKETTVKNLYRMKRAHKE